MRILVIVALIWSSVLEATSADFIAQGVLTNLMPARSSGGTVENKASVYLFNATVTNGCWHLLVKSVLHSTPADTREYIAFYDGTNTHFVDIWHANGAKVRELRKSENGMVMSNGSVTFEPLLWAFGGGSFLKQHKTGSALKYGQKQQVPKAEWDTYTDEFGAPRHIRLLSLGMLPTADGVERRRRAPYDQGYVQGKFTVLESTQSGNVTVPLKFVLESYVPLPNGVSTNDLAVVRQGTCLVTNVIGLK